MTREKLPDEAFDFYVRLGPERSYQAVAVHYGVSKRTVATRAGEENWVARVASLDGALLSASGRQRQAQRTTDLQDALGEVMTPQRVKAIAAAMLKRIVEKGDVNAARLLLDRVLGRPRNEPLPASAVDIPDGLSTPADVRGAANALLQAVADGSLAPEDAAKAVTVVEAARKAIETEDLEKRIAAIEESIKKERAP